MFLTSFEPAKALPYLPDVARLEWHIATAYHAADARPIGATALGQLGDDALDAGLVLHPSCAIVLSHYPVFSIWQHQHPRRHSVQPSMHQPAARVR